MQIESRSECAQTHTFCSARQRRRKRVYISKVLNTNSSGIYSVGVRLENHGRAQDRLRRPDSNLENSMLRVPLAPESPDHRKRTGLPVVKPLQHGPYSYALSAGKAWHYAESVLVL